MVRWVPAVLGCLLLQACASFTPKPLDPAETIAHVDELRRAPDGAERIEGDTQRPGFTLALAAQWMREHGPAVKEAVAAYETALARARIATPLPNPGVEAGLQWAFGSDVQRVNQVTPLGSIGFSIPLGPRLSRQDELNQAQAEVARVEALASYRESYLELRKRYTALVIARSREQLQEAISAAARRTVGVARQLVDAGSATAVDLALFELEHARNLSAQLRAEQVTTATEAGLSELIGVHAALFAQLEESPLPELPPSPPDLETLRDLLVAHHPIMGRLRAKYGAAERSLRLEIARQYPDFNFGPFYDGEAGERKHVLGLTLGLELPLFDRNQQAIAEATERREEVRVQYEAAANRALAELEGAFRSVELTSRRRELLQEQIMPRAAASIRMARDSLSAGSGDALRLLDAERSHREIQVELLEAELAEREAWSALERALGYPLMTFPSEPPDSAAREPEGLEPQFGVGSAQEEDSK